MTSWRRDLTQKDPALRRSAAFALGKIGAEAAEAISPLTEALKDSDPRVRDAAAFALGDIAFAADHRLSGNVWLRASTALQGLLKDPEARVRRSAAYALGQCGLHAREELPALRSALGELLRLDGNPLVRQNAAWALGMLAENGKGDEETLKLLLTAVQNSMEDSYVLREIVNALAVHGNCRPEDTADTLLLVLPSVSDRVVIKPLLQALEKFASRKQERLVNVVEKWLDDKDPDIQRTAAFLTANTAGPKGGKALKVLVQILLEGDEQDQELASAALANLGPAAGAAVEVLARVLDDRSKKLETRRAAVLALSRVKENVTPAMPSLVKALAPEEHEHIRECAAEALAAIKFDRDFKGRDAVIKELVRVLREDKSPRIRQRALWALYSVPVLKDYGVLDPLLAIVREKKDPALKILRYDAARMLAYKLQNEAPAVVVDVLEEMINDDNITVYTPSDTRVTSGSSETTGGQATLVNRQGGDARFMAAQGIYAIGRPADRPRIRSALGKLKEATDPEVRKWAQRALDRLDGKE